MGFLTQQIGPLPLWGWAIAIIGGVVIFLVIKRMQSGGQSASSTSGVAGANPAYNPLNPSNDPSIDPNTGIPYAIEESTNPNTGLPNYYNSGLSQADAHQLQYQAQQRMEARLKAEGRWDAAPPTVSGPPITGQPIRANPISQPGSYTFSPMSATGQTPHLSNVAMQTYGVTGASETNAATQAIINANPALYGKASNYQPPAGTQIVIPQY